MGVNKAGMAGTGTGGAGIVAGIERDSLISRGRFAIMGSLDSFHANLGYKL